MIRRNTGLKVLLTFIGCMYAVCVDADVPVKDNADTAPANAAAAADAPASSSVSEDHHSAGLNEGEGGAETAAAGASEGKPHHAKAESHKTDAQQVINEIKDDEKQEVPDAGSQPVTPEKDEGVISDQEAAGAEAVVKETTQDVPDNRGEKSMKISNEQGETLKENIQQESHQPEEASLKTETAQVNEDKSEKEAPKPGSGLPGAHREPVKTETTESAPTPDTHAPEQTHTLDKDKEVEQQDGEEEEAEKRKKMEGDVVKDAAGLPSAETDAPPPARKEGEEDGGKPVRSGEPYDFPADPSLPPAPTDVKKVEEDLDAPKQVDDMPSFDEWKKQRLAEQAEVEKTKQLEAQTTTKAQKNGNRASEKKSGKKGVNYASMSCGAKVLATNPEAQNTGYILTENKDQYMIQPCKAKKWLIVELCEPIQVRSLEIANFELFSSLPESFIVQTSDRHPTKEWKALGTFHARDERSVQSFSLVDEDMYAKYIRLEMLQHFGHEHYCPLSIIRVYGTTMEEDYEYSEQEPHPAEEDLDGEGLGVDEPTKNLFTSATDTVLSMVKNVLSPGEKEGVVDPDLDEIVRLNNTAQNQSSFNSTVAEAKKEPYDDQPCTPSVTIPGSVPEKDSEGESPSDQPVPPCPVPTVSPSGDHKDNEGEEHYPSLPEADVKKRIENPMVTLIETPSDQAASITARLRRCNYCTHGKVDSCRFSRSTLCGYYKTLVYVYPTSCVVNTSASPAHRSDPVKSRQGKAPVSESIPGGPRVTAMKTETIKDGEKASSTIQATPTQITPTATEADINENQVGDSEVDASQIRPSATTSDDANAGSATTPQLTVDVSTQDVTTAADGTLPPSSSSSLCESGSMALDCSMKPEILQVRPTSVEETVTATAPEIPSTPPVSSSSNGVELELDDIEYEAGNEELDNHANQMKDIYAEAPSEQVDKIELRDVPSVIDADGEMVKLSKKSTAFMTLKNRMKALELNLNLSSRYLEELSQRYRRQMEEMYQSLNKTIARLANTSKSAETRDMKQQEHIAVLTSRIDNLSTMVERLTSSIDHVHAEVIERHLFLMAIEMVVFITLMAWCLNRHHHHHAVPPSVAMATPANSQLHHSDKTSSKQKSNKKIPGKPPDDPVRRHMRRSSLDATPTRPRSIETLTPRRSADDINLRLSGSEQSFNIVEPDLSVFINAKPENLAQDILPKRKKRKKHQKQASLGGGSSNGLQLTSEQPKNSRDDMDRWSLSPVQGSPSSVNILDVSHSSYASALALSSDLSLNGPSDGNKSLHRRFSDQPQNLTHTKSVPSLGGRSKKPPPSRRSLDLSTTSNKTMVNGTGTKSGSSTPVANVGSLSNGHIKAEFTFNKANKKTAKMPLGKASGLMNGAASHTEVSNSWKHWFPGSQR